MQTLEEKLAELMATKNYSEVRNASRSGIWAITSSPNTLRNDYEGTIIADSTDKTRQGVLWVFSRNGEIFEADGKKADPVESNDELPDLRGRQIPLDKEPLEQNKQFMRAIFESDLIGAHKWFDKLDDGTLYRTRDTEMNLETFLGMLSEDAMTLLEVSAETSKGEISFFVRLMARGCDKFAWAECPFTQENYNIVQKLFAEAYSQQP